MLRGIVRLIKALVMRLRGKKAIETVKKRFALEIEKLRKRRTEIVQRLRKQVDEKKVSSARSSLSGL